MYRSSFVSFYSSSSFNREILTVVSLLQNGEHQYLEGGLGRRLNGVQVSGASSPCSLQQLV